MTVPVPARPEDVVFPCVDCGSGLDWADDELTCVNVQCAAVPASPAGSRS